MKTESFSQKESSRPPLYAFGVISDVHIKRGGHSCYYDGVADYTGSEENYGTALKTLGDSGMSFISMSGDVGCDGAGPAYGCDTLYPDDLVRFRELTETYNRTAENPVRICTCRGDHDFGWAKEDWDENVMALSLPEGADRSFCPENPATFAETVCGDLFIYLSMDRAERAVGVTYADPYTVSADWAAEQLEKHPEKKAFLFSHMPLDGVSGQRFENASIDEKAYCKKRLLDAIRSRGYVTAFSGHTHLAFESSRYFPQITFVQEENGVSFVNIPSCGYEAVPVSADPGEKCRKDSTIPEGFIVRVYPDKTEVEGICLITGKKLLAFSLNR